MNWKTERTWLIIFLGIVVALWLGYDGFAVYGQTHNRAYTRSDLLYLAWQLFPLQSGALEGPIPWQIEVARVLAPLVAAYAIFQVLYAFARERWQVLRLAFLRNHVVVCGLGTAGQQLVRDALRLGKHVVAIEQDGNAPGVQVAREEGALVIVDLANAASLQRARVARAEALFAACGDDAANIDVALAAADARRKTPESGGSGSLACFVEIVDYSVAALFRDHAILDAARGLDISIFNVYENAARALLRDHPLDREFIGPDDPRRVHIVLFGLGEMGEGVLLQAAKLGHFANGKRLRITVIDRNAENRQRGLLARYPALGEVCDINFCPWHHDDPRALECVASLAADSLTLGAVAICFDDDSRNAQFALLLRQLQEALPIFVRVNTESGLARLFGCEDGNRHGIWCFGAPSSTCSWPIVRAGTLDRLAREIHRAYVEKQHERNLPDSPSMLPWEQLPQALRESNRQQADHLMVKLRALGYCVRGVAEFPDEVAVPEALVEPLARMEHARWSADRFLSGWKLGKKDVAKKRTPYLIPYDELPEEIKEYDRDAVRNIPELVRTAKRKGLTD